MPLREADIDIVLVSPPHRDPLVAPRPSHPALSLAVHPNARLLVFFSVTEADVPLVPKLTCSGETVSFAPLPASESTSTGEEEQETAIEATSAAAIADRTRIEMGCTEISVVRGVGG